MSFNSQWSCCFHHCGSSTDCCWPGTGRGRWVGGNHRRWCQTPPNVSSLAAAPPLARSPRGEGWPEVRGDRRTHNVTKLAERGQRQREFVQGLEHKHNGKKTWLNQREIRHVPINRASYLLSLQQEQSQYSPVQHLDSNQHQSLLYFIFSCRPRGPGYFVFRGRFTTAAYSKQWNTLLNIWFR